MSSNWLTWAQRLQAIAQTGLAFKNHPYDVVRYEQIQQIAAEMMAAYSDAEPSAITALFAQETGYATPKVDARGAVFQNHRVLLVQERSDGQWTLPGGWVDVGEPPSVAVTREIFEESGFHAKPVKLAAVFDRNHPRHGHTPSPFHIYKLFFVCDFLGGTATPSNETAAVEFFPLDALPELSLQRVVPSQIVRMYEHFQYPELPTDFD